MANISKLTLPNNITYDIKDNVSQFGGTNLLRYSAWGTAMQDGHFCAENGTGIDYNKVWNHDYKTIEIEYGISNYELGDIPESALPEIFPGDAFFCLSIPVYENTLNGTFNFVRKMINSTATTWAGQALVISAGWTGLYIEKFTTSTWECRGFFLDSIDTSAATSGSIVLGPPKIEVGNKPTDWTPCPWDLVTYKDNSLMFFS